MARTKSPFICGGPVPPGHFVGREEQVDAIMGQLTGPAHGGSAISGERRVGKTSLLHYLVSPQAAQDWDVPLDRWHFILLDCQQTDMSCSEIRFWQQVFDAIAAAVPGELAGDARALAHSDEVEEWALGHFFDRVAREDRLVILLLDEFEAVTEQVDRHNPTLLYQLRQLLNRQQRGMALITASREPVEVLCHDIVFRGSPFYNNLLSVWLPPFGDGEIEDLLARAAPSFSETEAAYIVRIGGRHPLLLQLAADEMYRARSRLRPGRALNLAAVGRSFERRARQHYRDIWDDMPPQDRLLLSLAALRSFHQVVGGLDYEVRFIDALLARFNRPLRTLTERGFLTADSPPLVLSSVGQWWLVEEITGDEKSRTGWEQLLSAQELTRIEGIVQAVQVSQQGLRALIRWAVEWPGA
ncbi:MAG: AAA family ATPase [Chloroflexota bacterium]